MGPHCAKQKLPSFPHPLSCLPSFCTSCHQKCLCRDRLTGRAVYVEVPYTTVSYYTLVLHAPSKARFILTAVTSSSRATFFAENHFREAGRECKYTDKSLPHRVSGGIIPGRFSFPELLSFGVTCAVVSHESEHSLHVVYMPSEAQELCRSNKRKLM